MSHYNIRPLRFSILQICVVVIFARNTALPAFAQEPAEESFYESEAANASAGESSGTENAEPVPVFLDEAWTYASYSVIHSDCAYLYLTGTDSASGRRDDTGVNTDNSEEYGTEKPDVRGITVCVNAGHGTLGGSDEQTLSHPDGSPKVTGGTTAEGAVYSTAISSGMTFPDGTSEADANLETALALKEMLLADGYDVLMIRENADTQLDNIARTVIANNMADIHVAIHFDSTENDKGVFYCSVPEAEVYRVMEPVASHWQEHEEFGKALIQGFSDSGFTVFNGGSLEMDLTQTSYSTIPSIDIEVGDRASDHSAGACEKYAGALKKGIDYYSDILITDKSDLSEK